MAMVIWCGDEKSFGKVKIRSKRYEEGTNSLNANGYKIQMGKQAQKWQLKVKKKVIRNIIIMWSVLHCLIQISYEAEMSAVK